MNSGYDLPPAKWSIALLIVVGASLFLSLSFMGVQVIHVDETTQLSGASIPPLAMLQWLAGEDPARFGVPSDRMPPLYYLMQQVWASMFGTSITAYRSLSLVLASIGVLFFAAVVRRISPGLWGLAVLAILALSMNYVQYSVVIRPYPLFFAISCIGSYALLRYCEVRGSPSETRWLAAVTATGIAAAYTHFYGINMFCAMQAALALLALWERRSIKPNIIALLVAVMFAAMLYPIFVASLDVNTTLPNANVSDFPKLVYRIVASRAAAVYTPVQIVLLAGIATAVCASLSHAISGAVRHDPPLQGISAFRFVAFAIVSLGLAVSLVGAIVVRGFNVLEPHYHIWLLPFVYSLLLVPRTMFATSVARLQTMGIAFTLAATATSAFIFYRNMSTFVSGPSGALQSVIDKLPLGTPVIYANSYVSSWYFASYPVRYIYQGKVRQYLADPDKPFSDFLVAEANNLFFAPKLETASEDDVIGTHEFLIYAHVGDMFVDQSMRFIRYGEPNIPEGDGDQKFAERFGYDVIEKGYYPSYTAIRISVLKRKH